MDAPDGERHLFDLKKDMAESHNLIDQRPARAVDMRSLLDNWESEVDPPLYDQRGQALKKKAAR